MSGGLIYMTEERTDQKIGELMRRRSELKKRRLGLGDDADQIAKKFRAAAETITNPAVYPRFDMNQLPERAHVVRIWEELAAVKRELAAIEDELKQAGIDAS